MSKTTNAVDTYVASLIAGETTEAALQESVAAGKLTVAQLCEIIRRAASETARQTAGSKPTKASQKEFNGHRVLEFSGNFRPFSLGASKLRAILACRADVERFLAAN